MENSARDPERKKSPEQLMREAVNMAGVSLVTAGFNAIDQITEMGKQRLKAAIIHSVSGKRPLK